MPNCQNSDRVSSCHTFLFFIFMSWAAFQSYTAFGEIRRYPSSWDTFWTHCSHYSLWQHSDNGIAFRCCLKWTLYYQTLIQLEKRYLLLQAGGHSTPEWPWVLSQSCCSTVIWLFFILKLVLECVCCDVCVSTSVTPPLGRFPPFDFFFSFYAITCLWCHQIIVPFRSLERPLSTPGMEGVSMVIIFVVPCWKQLFTVKLGENWAFESWYCTSGAHSNMERWVPNKGGGWISNGF